MTNMELDEMMVNTKWNRDGTYVVHVLDAETDEVVAEVTVAVTGVITDGLKDAKTKKPVREEIEKMAFALATYAASCVGATVTKPKRSRAAAKKR